MKLTNKKIQLTDDDTEWLMNIFNARYNSLFPLGILRLFATILIYAHFIYFFLGLFHDIFFYSTIWLREDFFTKYWLIKVLVGGCITTGAVIWQYKYLVLPFRKDVEAQYKTTALFTVIRKEYFPVVNQYYIYAQEFSERGLQLSKEEYDSCVEGSDIELEVSAITNIILLHNANVKTKLNFLSIKRI